MKKLYLILVSVIAVLTINAQTLTVSAPSHVQNGENFHLKYIVNTQNAADFRIGGIPDGLEVVTGPYTSTQSSFQMVNGHTSSSSSITYTFILCANKNGTYSIPPAHINANGKQIASQAVKIVVSGGSGNHNGTPRMHNDEDDMPQVRAAGTPVTGNDLFIKVSANKRRVYEQEPILLTYKVYTLVGLTQFEGNMPDLTGFHSQEVKLPQQKSLHVENVNGKSYRTGTWSQYVMYPQMTGKLEIPSITFEGTVVQKNHEVDPFEEFFNGGSGYIEVKRSIKAPSLTIQVDPLPAKPADFSGGVGRFNISAQMNKSVVKANEPITLRVVIGGTGNLKLIKQPIINLPKDFDKYDPKVTDKTKLTVNGVEGNIIYDFLAVPRNQGEYKIPPVEFTYFDLGSKSYKTIKTQSFDLKVEKGSGGTGNSADFTSEKNQDIRSIKTGNSKSLSSGNLFFGSKLYWTLLLMLFIIFIVLMILFRKRAIENADIVKMKGKKANKIATKRLKLANKLMHENKPGEFYDEVLRALWGYMGDKLNIPVTDLSHDNIAEKLVAHNVDTPTINKFIEALDECEYERYAPGDSAGNMLKTFESAITAITEIEDVMKKKPSTSKINALVLLLLLLPASSWAITKEDADAEYSKGNYVQAIKLYEELLKKDSNSDLYYNLGNAYYRTDNITRAVINYERALLLSPADEDIRFNLQMARSKTIDKIMPQSEMFFFAWYRSLVNMMNIDSWANLALISILLTLILALVYLFSSNILLRKIGFFGGLFFIVLFILSNIFAFQQTSELKSRDGAIVIVPSTVVKKTPSTNSSDQGVIHEGTRVDIMDDTMREWKGVRLADGREGWVQTSAIEKI